MSTNNNAANIATFMEEVQQKRKEFITLTVKFYKDVDTSNSGSDDYIQLSILATSQTEYYFLTPSTKTAIQSILNNIAKQYQFNLVPNYQDRYSFNEDILLDVLQSIAKRLPVINVDEFYISQNLMENVQYLKNNFDELKTTLAKANAQAKANANANAITKALAQPGDRSMGWNQKINGGRKKTYTVAILKEKLRKQGKAVSGTKAELEKRLSL